MLKCTTKSADNPLQRAWSKIDTPLKISSLSGVICGTGLLSSIAYTFLTLNQRPVDHSIPPIFPFVMVPGLIDSSFILIGALVLVFAPLNNELKGVLGFLVFLGSLLAVIGSMIILNYPA